MKKKSVPFFNIVGSAAIVLLVIVLSVIYVFLSAERKNLEEIQDRNEHEVVLENLSADYVNEGENTVQMRYKISLNNEKADSVDIGDWDNSKPLFSIYEDGLLISSSYLNYEFSKVIPDVSNTFSLKPGQSTNNKFQVRVNKDAKEFQSLVRFEVGIVVEELKADKWSPVYQVNFMERGPYWELSKGPIEISPAE